MRGNVKLIAYCLSIIQRTTFASLSLFLLACGGTHLRSHPQIRHVAPTNEQDAGTIVGGVSAQEVVQFLDANPESRARIINDRRGIYEVFGSDKPKLQRQWPKAQVAPNHFFSTFELPMKGLTYHEKLKIIAQSFENSPPAGDKLQPCVEDPEAPNAEIESLGSSQEILDPTINLGDELTLTGEGSTPHASHPSPLRIGWMVVPPTGSKMGEQIFLAKQLNYKPDAYGAYNILMLVQDARNVCAATSYDLVVTGNQPYAGSEADTSSILSQFDKKIFSHLEELQAEPAQVESGNQGDGIVVAVIDTGVNYNHPALLKNAWINTQEIASNASDDDNDGKVDDVVGYDFINDDPWPFDDQGHGSHVSGLAVSSFFGLAPKAKFMALKALSPMGGDIASIVGAIYYAIEKKVQIINMSIGSYSEPHPFIIVALNEAEKENIVVVAAAGNGHPTLGTGLDTDKFPNYPSALTNKNIIAVAAKDSTHLLAPYSNFGRESVDVAAPGGNPPDDPINSCYLENPANIVFTGLAGTSMATPIVSGVVALMLSANPHLTPEQIRDILLHTGPQIPELEPLIASGRYINALEAVQAAKTAPSLPNEASLLVDLEHGNGEAEHGDGLDINK